MIIIKVVDTLREEIYKKFKGDSHKIVTLIMSLKENPNKGKVVGHIGPISIRELKFEGFRFYFILIGHELSLFNKKKIEDLLIKFINMSKKNDQQKTIEQIKETLEIIKFNDV